MTNCDEFQLSRNAREKQKWVVKLKWLVIVGAVKQFTVELCQNKHGDRYKCLASIYWTTAASFLWSIFSRSDPSSFLGQMPSKCKKADASFPFSNLGSPLLVFFAENVPRATGDQLFHQWSFFWSSSKYTKIFLGKFYFFYLWKIKKYTNSNIQIHKFKYTNKQV